MNTKTYLKVAGVLFVLQVLIVSLGLLSSSSPVFEDVGHSSELGVGGVQRMGMVCKVANLTEVDTTLITKRCLLLVDDNGQFSYNNWNAIKAPVAVDKDGTPGTPGAGLTHSLQSFSGRFYCFADDRWVTSNDDNYGQSYYQFQESGLTGTDPLIEWEWLGHVLPQGETLESIPMYGRVNNLEVTDLEIRVYARYANPLSRHTTGMDNDAEDNTVLLYQGNWMDADGTTFTGNTNDKHYRELPINYTMAAPGEIIICVKPVNTGTTTRHFLTSYSFKLK